MKDQSYKSNNFSPSYTNYSSNLSIELNNEDIKDITPNFTEEKGSILFGNRKFFPNFSFLSYGNDLLYFSFSLLIYLTIFILALYLSITEISEKNTNIFKTITISFSVILYLFNTFLMFKVSLSDPGFFVPISLSNDIKEPNEIELTVTKDKDSLIFLKYCKTCHIVRNLRVFHCKYCNLCVLRHDHHCHWLSNCIGLNNHKIFIFFLFCCLIHIIYNISLFLYIIIALVKISITSKIRISLYVTEMLSTFILLIFIVILLCLHIYLIFSNQTTSEFLRREKIQKNPFDKGSKWENLNEYFNSPLDYQMRFQYTEESLRELKKSIMLSAYIGRKNRLKENQEEIEMENL